MPMATVKKADAHAGMMTEQAFWKAANSRSLSGTYFLFGAEELTKNLAVSNVVSLLDEAGRDLNYQVIRPNSVDELIEACNQMPFLDSLRVVMLREWDSGLASLLTGGAVDANGEPVKKKNAGNAKEAFRLVDPATVLLVVMRGENTKDAVYGWFLKNAKERMVFFDPLTEDRAANMIAREAALRGVTISKADALYIVHLCGTDGYRVKNEFSKAADYAGPGGTVTKAVIDTVVTRTEEATSFEILDMLLAGKKKAGLRLLVGDLKAKTGDPFAYAGLFLSRLKPMLRARVLLDSGKNKAEAARILGGGYYYEKIVAQAASMNKEELVAAISAFSEVDIHTKQGVCSPEEGLTLAIHKSFK